MSTSRNDAPPSASSQTKGRRRDTVTTQSILEAFLLQQTALDDTLLRDELLEDLDLANGSGAKGKQRHSLAQHPAMPYILKDLNSQRAEVRAGVAQQITRFSEQYEAQPVLKKRFDVQQDPQKELLKEDLALREAIKRLKATRAELQDSVGSLEAQLHEREERLTAAVDQLVRTAAGRQDQNDRSGNGDAEASRGGTSTHTM